MMELSECFLHSGIPGVDGKPGIDGLNGLPGIKGQLGDSYPGIKGKLSNIKMPFY